MISGFTIQNSGKNSYGIKMDNQNNNIIVRSKLINNNICINFNRIGTSKNYNQVFSRGYITQSWVVCFTVEDNLHGYLLFVVSCLLHAGIFFRIGSNKEDCRVTYFSDPFFLFFLQCQKYEIRDVIYFLTFSSTREY